MVEVMNYVEIDVLGFISIEGLITSPHCHACVASRTVNYFKKFGKMNLSNDGQHYINNCVA